MERSVLVDNVLSSPFVSQVRKCGAESPSTSPSVHLCLSVQDNPAPPSLDPSFCPSLLPVSLSSPVCLISTEPIMSLSFIFSVVTLCCTNTPLTPSLPLYSVICGCRRQAGGVSLVPISVVIPQITRCNDAYHPFSCSVSYKH